MLGCGHLSPLLHKVAYFLPDESLASPLGDCRAEIAEGVAHRNAVTVIARRIEGREGLFNLLEDVRRSALIGTLQEGRNPGVNEGNVIPDGDDFLIVKEFTILLREGRNGILTPAARLVPRRPWSLRTIPAVDAAASVTINFGDFAYCPITNSRTAHLKSILVEQNFTAEWLIWHIPEPRTPVGGFRLRP